MNRPAVWTLSVYVAGMVACNAAGEVGNKPPAVAGSTDAAPGADAAIRRAWASWNEPVKPFRIIGNVYYVGVAGVSSFLVTTAEGHILIDTGFETTVPRIQESVAQLGFRLPDIKILLSSH